MTSTKPELFGISYGFCVHFFTVFTDANTVSCKQVSAVYLICDLTIMHNKPEENELVKEMKVNVTACTMHFWEP